MNEKKETMFLVCVNCGKKVDVDTLNDYPPHSREWLLQITRETKCCKQPDFQYKEI